MNYIVGIVLATAVFFVSKKLFATFIFMGVQVVGNVLIDRFGISRIPILNWDLELSNIIIIIATLTIGPGFALLLGIATVGYHAFHEEVTDIHSVIDYTLRAAIIVGVIWAGLSIPMAILLSKIPVFVLNKVLWGSHLWSLYNYNEVFAVAAYFAVFSLF